MTFIIHSYFSPLSLSFHLSPFSLPFVPLPPWNSWPLFSFGNLDWYHPIMETFTQWGQRSVIQSLLPLLASLSIVWRWLHTFYFFKYIFQSILFCENINQHMQRKLGFQFAYNNNNNNNNNIGFNCHLSDHTIIGVFPKKLKYSICGHSIFMNPLLQSIGVKIRTCGWPYHYWVLRFGS